MVANVDNKRLGNTNENSNEGIRRRKGKEPETNGRSDGGSSNTAEMKLPVVNDLLRELLKK